MIETTVSSVFMESPPDEWLSEDEPMEVSQLSPPFVMVTQQKVPFKSWRKRKHNFKNVICSEIILVDED